MGKIIRLIVREILTLFGSILMANPEEQKDIDALKEKQVELKLRCVD